MKSTNNRFYFDYNATSPVANSVMEWLCSGDLPFANPSSVHLSGKNSRRPINQTRDYLSKIFGLKDHRLFFHSGASEGINSIVKGLAHSLFIKDEKLCFVYAKTDHSAVKNLTDDLEAYGHKVVAFNVDENGDFDKRLLIDLIKKQKEKVLLNYTFVNNENGVVWPLEDAAEIKKETSCYVHVDAVQAVGKIPHWKELSKELDSYTFSGHKFGSLKGIGFSFISEDLPFHSMVHGGGQQEGLRSGTENVHGVYSLKLALEELEGQFDFEQMLAAKILIEEDISRVSEKLIVVSKDALRRNGNTINVIVPGQKADILLTAFDLAKMDVSSGSACSSGSVVPSRVLLSMGYSEDLSKSAIRFSFSPYLTTELAKEYAKKICTVLKRFV